METKKELRKKVLNIRNQMSEEDIKNNSQEIMNKIINLSIYKQSKAVFIYMSFKNEVITSELIKKMFNDKKKVVIPYTDMVNTLLIPSEIKDENDLVLNPFGYYEPREIIKFPVEKIDLVIVPGVVFDNNLNRIGYGKGYYDRILSSVRPDVKKVAIAHDFQVLDSIPKGEHDIKMDMIITEKRVIAYGTELR